MQLQLSARNASEAGQRVRGGRFFQQQSRRARETYKKRPKPAELALQEMNSTFVAVNQRLMRNEDHTLNDVRAVETHDSSTTNGRASSCAPRGPVVPAVPPHMGRALLCLRALCACVFCTAAVRVFEPAVRCTAYSNRTATSLQSAMYIDRAGKLGPTWSAQSQHLTCAR